MRILHIGKYYPPFSGGIENFMAQLLPRLSGAGTEIEVLVHNHHIFSAKPVTESVEGISVHRAPSHGRLLYAPVSPAFPLILNKVLKEFKPELLHIHMPNTSAFWALFLPRAAPVPKIIHWHSDVVQSRINKVLKIAYRFYRPFEYVLLQKACSVIATSPHYLQTSSALKRFKNKVSVVPLAVSENGCNRSSPEEKAWAELLWGGKRVRILSVGRLTYYKGHSYLVKAVEKVEDTRLIIVGEGELKGRLSTLISDRTLDTRVTLAGHVGRGKLAALMESADIVVQPAVERTEAFCLVLLEAMQAGKPTIVTNVEGSGMAWIVEHGTTGLHVPPMNTGTLSAAIQLLAENPRMRAQMGKAGNQRLKQHFNLEKVTSSILNIYNDCL